jgi:hypothetical protein
MAQEMDQVLKVGSVYYISNGQLSGANRRYSTTGNDYRINFNQKTEVKAASDQVIPVTLDDNLLCLLQSSTCCIICTHVVCGLPQGDMV